MMLDDNRTLVMALVLVIFLVGVGPAFVAMLFERDHDEQ